MELDEKEKKVLVAMFHCWADSDYPLPGNVSYKDAIDLFGKLGIKPDRLLTRLAELESK